MQPTLYNPVPQPLRNGLASSRILRSMALPLLQRLDRPIKVTHPFSDLPFHLLSYSHKDYWLYRKSQETEAIDHLARLIRRGDTVFEVGANIGFVSQFLASKVGHTGQVHIFDPGQQNAPFLRKNIARCLHCVHINAAVSDHIGKAMFFEGSTGKTVRPLRSDVMDPAGLDPDARPVERGRKVNATTLDAYVTAHNVWPQVVKINAGGSALAVLHGGMKAMQAARCAIIDLAQDHHAVFETLTDLGFVLSQQDGTVITSPPQGATTIVATRPPARA